MSLTYTKRNLASPKKLKKLTKILPSPYKNHLESFQSFSTLSKCKWLLPQRIDSNSPLGKTLASTKDAIRSEAKLDKAPRKLSPEIIFSRQPLKVSVPKPAFSEEFRSTSTKRPVSAEKISKRLVIIGRTEVKEIEFTTRKTPLRQHFIN